MKIVHAVRSHRFAGVEQHIRRLALAQAAAGDVVHVVGGDPDRMADALAAGGVTFARASTIVDVVRRLHSLGSPPDVVNSHMTAADTASVIACRGADRPALVSTRHFAQARARFRPLGRWVDGQMDAEIAVSDTVAAHAAVPTIVVPSGVESVPISDAPRERVVLIAQRLEREKHTDDGLRAFAYAGIAGEGWRLVIAGEGTERERLEALARDLGIASATSFLGFRDDLPQIMVSSGMMLAPCPFEHLGLSVLEAMAAGLPVIAAGAGGHLELLAGLDSRALFLPRDIQAASRALRSLAHDPAGRDALASRSTERQRTRHSLAAQVAGTRAVYETAIERRRA